MRRVTAAYATVALLVLAGCGSSAEDPALSAEQASPTATETTKVESAAPEPTDERTTEQPQPTRTPEREREREAKQSGGEGEWLLVADVVDGDTIKVERGGEIVTLRLIGMDTPETVHPSRGVECYGPEASARAHELLNNASVRLEFDPSQGRFDKYGRTLAYVWMRDGRMFNEVMIEEGYAEEYTYDTAYKYQARFRAAEEAARAAGKGIWGSCDTWQEEQPAEEPADSGGGTDPRFDTCREAIAAGYGPYYRGQDPEYEWYQDRDGDGVVCES